LQYFILVSSLFNSFCKLTVANISQESIKNKKPVVNRFIDANWNEGCKWFGCGGGGVLVLIL